jgi:chaperonin GroES
MKFKPLHDRLLLEPISAETKTKSGIIIPDTAQEKPQQGRWSRSAPASASRTAA